MGRKSYIGLSAFLIFVLTLLCLVFLPLQVWSKQIQTVLPKGVQVREMSGHWWSGQALIDAKGVTEPLQISWTMPSICQPVEWFVQHSQVKGHGRIRPSVFSVSTWVDEMTIHPNLLRSLFFPRAEKITGSLIEIDSWSSQYSFSKQRFTEFSGRADWSSGELSYGFNSNKYVANVQQWRIEGALYEDLPTIELISVSEGALLDAMLRPNLDLEITIMPKLIQLFGYHWPGRPEYPAFVMLKPLFDSH